MSHTLSRRNVVKGSAWAAPVVVATAAVPAYAASFTCPEGSSVQFSRVQSGDSTNIVHEVTAAYNFTNASKYTTIVVTSNEPMTLVGAPDGAVLSNDGRTLTVTNSGASAVSFSVTSSISDATAGAAGYALSLTSTINGQCALTDTYNNFGGSAG